MVSAMSLWSYSPPPDRDTILDRLIDHLILCLPVSRRDHETALEAMRAACELRLQQQREYYQGEIDELHEQLALAHKRSRL